MSEFPEVELQIDTTLTITTTPQQIVPARQPGSARSYLSLFNNNASNAVHFCADLEYNAPGFNTATSGRQVNPDGEYWEQAGDVPSNAFWAWTLSGTALLDVQEG